MPMIYAGIGSRETPPDVCELMTKIAIYLRNHGYILRSGHADGADMAFENGAGDQKEIWIPWLGFNCSKSRLVPTTQAKELAAKYHPAWNKCSHGARLLHARNGHQVLGHDLATPAEFIICWTKAGLGGGGTGQALRIAKDHNILIHDLALSEQRDLWKRTIN